jgi:probable F420-dependent oxidoreductase
MLSDLTPAVTDVAPLVEERGFESLWVGEHTHLPVDTVHSYTQGRYAGTKARDGYVPDFYRRFPDPYITLAAAAACTSTIRIGTCIALPAEHSPIILAKEIATLDRLSGGRFEFGVGYGWNPLEMRNNGFDKADRRRVMREKVLAMKALWTQPTASFEGEFVNFTESYSYPKPTQQPHPPILLGAAPTAANLDDVVAWADGWIPVRSFMGEGLAEGVQALRQRAEGAGRRSDELTVTIVDPEGSMGGKRSPDEFARRLPTPAVLDQYREIGIHRLTLGVPVGDLATLCGALDRVVELRASVGV